MKECIEKMKKEYSAPQMEVMDCKAQELLSGSDDPTNIDVCIEGSENC